MIFPQLGLPKGVLTVDKVLDAWIANFQGSVPQETGDFDFFIKRLLHMRKSRKSGSSPAMSKVPRAQNQWIDKMISGRKK